MQCWGERPGATGARGVDRGLGLLAAALVGFLAGCGQTGSGVPIAGNAALGQPDIGDQVQAFCGDCHALPSPGTFPRRAWRGHVELGYQLYLESGRDDLTVPLMNSVIEYYQARAPEELVLRRPDEATGGKLIRFDRTDVEFPHPASLFPAVAHLRWLSPREAGGPRLLFCDMNTGEARQLVFDGRTPTVSLLGKFSNPDHIEPCVWDGVPGFAVADLGSFLPADHRDGKVVWCADQPGGESSVTVIQDQLGRVADVQPGDFDEDGDLDFLVAEFGWRSTGRLLLLKRPVAADGRTDRFRQHVLDDRHGTIHIPVADLNSDGHLDFVALLSQEFEMVVAFLNRGDGSFEQRMIFAAGDPSFGSSGIQLVDLDGDGDLDVVYTSGDTLDGYYLKPEHAVHWLENEGTFPFRAHVLTPLPGAMRALAADLDGDQDLDVVACAYLPDRLLGTGDLARYDTVIWLEQLSRGQFARHTLERSDHGYMALEVGDFDADGWTDLAIGTFDNRPRPGQHWLSLWWGTGENVSANGK